MLRSTKGRACALAGLLVFCAIGVAYAQAIPVVDDCRESDYLDRSAPAADRTFNWTYSFAGDPERCIVVRVGQSLQWQGNLGDHPLDPDQGDQPNPIAAHVNGVVLFDRPGIFGYRCNFHLAMRGAVRVLPAQAPAVPAGGALANASSIVLLLAAGALVARRPRSEHALRS